MQRSLSCLALPTAGDLGGVIALALETFNRFEEPSSGLRNNSFFSFGKPVYLQNQIITRILRCLKWTKEIQAINLFQLPTFHATQKQCVLVLHWEVWGGVDGLHLDASLS